ncbi:MAG TPA: phosphomannose isomerase type II C-terminal cupin domain [Mycobacteriales bacterium]|nr:phosphomannose isomerase type II C-terminal cupin domain [Mycobacteriales bacterium]
MPDEESVRPWGHYEILASEPDFKTKTILVQPGRRLSYQRHERRAEHWVIVRGHGVVTLDGAEHAVEPGVAIDIPAGACHRIENTGTLPLVFVEVQLGDYFGEDDIVRLDDDFGRAEVG